MVPLRVWRDGDTYKMLYAAYAHRSEDKNPGLGGGHHLCYAESADGYQWQRPSLGRSSGRAHARTTSSPTHPPARPSRIHAARRRSASRRSAR